MRGGAQCSDWLGLGPMLTSAGAKGVLAPQTTVCKETVQKRLRKIKGQVLQTDQDNVCPL